MERRLLALSLTLLTVLFAAAAAAETMPLSQVNRYAEGLIAQALKLGTPAQSWNVDQSFWLQTFALRRDVGGLEALQANVFRLIDQNPTVVYWRWSTRR